MAAGKAEENSKNHLKSNTRALTLGLFEVLFNTL